MTSAVAFFVVTTTMHAATATAAAAVSALCALFSVAKLGLLRLEVQWHFPEM